MQPISTVKRVVNQTLGREVSDEGLPVVLELDLSRGIQSTAPSSPLTAFNKRLSPSLRDIREGLRAAATDDEVLGLVVHTGVCPLTLSEADEVSEVIRRFGRHKPTVAWTETFGELTGGLTGYRVALAADEIWVQPSGGLGIPGAGLEITLFRGGLEKLGVDPQFAQRWEYKSAADQFAAREVTDANQEMMQRLADSLVEQTVTMAAERRGVSEQTVWQAVNGSPLTAEAAQQAGLVDRLGYRNDVYDQLRLTLPEPVADVPERPRFRLQYVHRYEHKRQSPVLRMFDRSKANLAVVTVDGPIVLGPSQPRGGSAQAGSDTVAAQLRAAGRDDHVQGVLLRVVSPGGSYVASDTIRHEVKTLVEAGKPVVAAMGSVAASGGYFVAMGATEIVATPATLTGSIGVLGGRFAPRGLLDKLGLVTASISAGERAGMWSRPDGFTEDEWGVLNDWLDLVYADFTEKAAADRKLPLAELEPLARGRVWTGSDAVVRKLIDHVGGVSTALERLYALTGVAEDKAKLHSGPAWAFLSEVRGAESSESSPLAAAVLPTPTAGVEQLVQRWGDQVGLGPVPGALTMPYRITIR